MCRSLYATPSNIHTRQLFLDVSYGQEKMLRSERIKQQKAQIHQALHDFRLEMNLQETLLRENLHEKERTGRLADFLDLDATMFCATLGRSTFKVRLAVENIS